MQPPVVKSARKPSRCRTRHRARFAEGVYFFCWVGPKLEAVTDVTSEGFGR